MIVEPDGCPAPSSPRGTGWTPKPQGACLGEVCVPLPGETDRRDRPPGSSVWYEVVARSGPRDRDAATAAAHVDLAQHLGPRDYYPPMR